MPGIMYVISVWGIQYYMLNQNDKCNQKRVFIYDLDDKIKHKVLRCESKTNTIIINYKHNYFKII